MYGYHGKILHVDLTTRTYRQERKPEAWYRMYIGGVSMAARLLWENSPAGVDPLSPDNPICISNNFIE